MKPSAPTAFKRTVKGSDDSYYGSSIPSEETSAFTKRVKLEETSKSYYNFLFKSFLTTIIYLNNNFVKVFSKFFYLQYILIKTNYLQ